MIYPDCCMEYGTAHHTMGTYCCHVPLADCDRPVSRPIVRSRHCRHRIQRSCVALTAASASHA